MSLRKPAQSAPSISDVITCSPSQLAFRVLGDRWTLLILRDLFLGYRRFEDLRASTNAARGTLTQRLTEMNGHGLLYKNPYQSNPSRYEYRLTDKGMDLYPLALVFWAWEHRWATDHEKLPDVLVHDKCGHKTIPKFCCVACGKIAIAAETEYTLHPDTGLDRGDDLSGKRRRSGSTSKNAGKDGFHAIDVLGDRWTGMVIAAISFRLHRYDEISNGIGISTNILADRLKQLTGQGVLVRKTYKTKPVRYEYHLTDKGRDLYGISVLLHQWGLRWLMNGKSSVVTLQHSCGNDLTGEVSCSHCHEPLKTGSVSFESQS